MCISNYIFQVLISKPTILMSWGFHNPMGGDNALMFKVNGFIHQGDVIVSYNEGMDLFDVQLLTPKGKLVKTIENIYVDQLIDVIDEAVEHTTDYNTRINNRYNFN
ncbi:hypothetical protein [uncultured Draconibacterium sp.]|uniref:hypothetical protein n=1 Tax=uncultured Draconibacterium sp. TaxID=1573823 RepID=UPI0029C6DCCD|nr:hypothetical protein [uncultured Draconibacterium sp.]